MANSNTFNVLARASTYDLKKKKKKVSRKKYERKKSNHYTHRQHEIFLSMRKTFKDENVNIIEDFKKARQWWDFAITKCKVAIKIKCSNTRFDPAPLESLGWKVLTIDFSDTNQSSYNHLIKEIRFVLDKPEWVAERAKSLNDNLPASEEWFLKKIKQEWFWRKMKFEQNVPLFGNYIYDLFSKKYRLCIEVDGSMHDVPEQQVKDNLKNQVTVSKGFHLIRVKAFDQGSYDAAKLLIEQIIENFKSRRFKIEQQQEFNNKIIELNKSGKLGF